MTRQRFDKRSRRRSRTEAFDLAEAWREARRAFAPG